MILWLSVRYASARREIFGINALRGKLHQLGSPNLQDIFIGGVSFSGEEISLIEKQDGHRGHFFQNYLLAVSHR